MDSSSVPPPPADPEPFPDLNLFPYPFLIPKIEPKSEPVEEIQENGPSNPTPQETVIGGGGGGGRRKEEEGEEEEPIPLQQVPPTPDEDALFSEYSRLAQLFLASVSQNHRRHVSNDAREIAPLQSFHHKSIVPMPDSGVSNAIVAAKKRKGRSGEMVRVTLLDARERRYFRDLVKRTRATYESLRVLLIREEEKVEKIGLLTKRSRADLKVAALMKERDLWLNRDKRIIGSIPGIYVGDVFFFRMELCVLGVHGQVQAGIDYVPASASSSREPIATSVIVSGGYEDDVDNGDTIVYTGHGGRERNLLRHSVHQKLEGGNLALERSKNYGIEIRVVRGFKCDRSPTNKIYVYDGLYNVVGFWSEVGKSGFNVYKYKLLRIEGQGELGSSVLKFAEDLKANLMNTRPVGYLSLDISMGKEKWPVSLFNDIDGDRDPLFFEYLVRPIYPPFAFQGMEGGCGGCDCVSSCSDNCYCADRNGGEFAYDGNGILLRGKTLIYECGSWCRCPPTCQNRVSQKGVRNRLEVFRSRETGWGVRPLDVIRAGAFICEFTGIVLTKQQSQLLSMNGDSLVYPNQFPERWLEWGDISQVFPDYVRPLFPSLSQLEFSIDVSRMRNVACYLSHSCSPNVFLQFVLYDHDNVSYPHLMIFAMENIPPLRELSIDYGVADALVLKSSP